MSASLDDPSATFPYFPRREGANISSDSYYAISGASGAETPRSAISRGDAEADSLRLDYPVSVSSIDDSENEVPIGLDGLVKVKAHLTDPASANSSEAFHRADDPVLSERIAEEQEAQTSYDRLIQTVASYLPPTDVDLIKKAYTFAASAHEGQMRKSGEPYITHPIATSLILADLKLDAAVIAAGLLHDVAEDVQSIGLEDITDLFGEEVARLVDGVTKLTRLNLHPTVDVVAPKPRDDEVNTRIESLRKMLLYMAEDVRVVLVKLADRLHNMRTLRYHKPASRRRISQETLDIYAPLASRLGIWEIKWQLEDLSFRYLEPERYKEIASLLSSRRLERERYINEAIEVVRHELDQVGIKAEVSGRPKHIYSISRKMERRGVDFNQILDLLAMRVHVTEVSDCYSVLGIVHSLWHPLPGQFDDYIAMPKESLYQSLHTTVIGPEGKPLEIQIRTHEMHRIAEYGVAAHWRYKEGTKRDLKFEQKIASLRRLLDWQKDLTQPQELMESLRSDLFQDQVYVFTPKGEIRDLPTGATPLDFAYRIHTDIGHRCIGAKVNHRLVQLSTPLKNGDIVEVLTSKTAKPPSRDWLNPNLNFVKTAHAREKIRQWFRRQQREENILRGRELLDKELMRLGLENTKVEEIVELFPFDKPDDLFAAIGCGEISPQSISTKLVTPTQPIPTVGQPNQSQAEPKIARGIQVMGVGDLLSRLARCCNPVPGEAIIGFITRGTGITIHRADCTNIANEDERERLINVEWGAVQEQVYPVNIRIEGWSRLGLLADVAMLVAEEKVNMSSVSAIDHNDRTSIITATLEVAELGRLSRVLSRIEGIKDVISVHRDVS